MDAVGLACVAFFFPCLTFLAIITFVVGGVGTLASRKNRNARIISTVVFTLGVCLAIYVGSAYVPDEFWLSLRPSYHLGDEELKPYQEAVTGFNRASLGFSDISQNAEIRILKDRDDFFTSCPDVELYIPNLPIKRQIICLAKDGDRYVWDSEYEVYLGPNSWESIWLAYSSRPDVLNNYGIEPYTLIIEYWGSSDIRLEGRTLTLEYIKPFLQEWRNYHEEHLETR